MKRAIESLKHVTQLNQELICIAQFQFRRNAYHLEKLLPVYLPEYETYVALTFELNKNTRATRITGIGLDLVDMKNKASLIGLVETSWLDPSRASPNRMVINRLVLQRRLTNQCRNQRNYNQLLPSLMHRVRNDERTAKYNVTANSSSVLKS